MNGLAHTPLSERRDRRSESLLDLFLLILMVALYAIGLLGLACHNRVQVCPEPKSAPDSSRSELSLRSQAETGVARSDDGALRGVSGRLVQVLVDEGHIDWLSDAGTWPPPPVGSASKANRLPFSTDCGRSTRKPS